ncbi:glycoside hydrolase family 2 TIM barrel-domain containing protein [Microbacterium trichothecenolyticum]|uniref:glycoside hydrolase family 2 TIM barrel-domain containing protein n=1 Tax=Microbacterium trichothecenolyticum TaxID=69370 RepID=UPI0035BE5CBC
MVAAATIVTPRMGRHSFNEGWTVRPKASIFFELGGTAPDAVAVTLPHDALIGEDRAAGNGRDSGFFPGGAFQYEKAFEVPEEWVNRHVELEFDGVYRDAVVFINDRFAGQRPSGYAVFRVIANNFLRYGEINTIRVEARVHEDSRWYTGAGIYRDVWLTVQEPVHVAADGIVVTTPQIEADQAVVAIATRIQNDAPRPRTAEISTAILDPAGTPIGQDTAKVTVIPGEAAVLRQRLSVEGPQLWSVDRPALYRVVTTVVDGDRIDERVTPFGIRLLQLDPAHGLRINGEVVKLRGACIHHDNGPIGSAAIARAEERRVELLKAAGFNAIRSAHNPISPAMLDACDRLGMLVMDELSDVWTESKNSFDSALDFPEWWARDTEAMVRKDINHPSVILYSIGNEIPETGDPINAVWGRRIAERIREIDPTRYITNGVNGMVAVIREFAAMAAQGDGAGGVNALMGGMNDLMGQISASELVSERTAESLAVLDVAGLNYGDSRYTLDLELFPHRITVGTETSPLRIADNWATINSQPNLIGDFTWTGWDYIGEAGLGRAAYQDDSEPPFGGSFPWLLAWCGDIDITGRRRPASFYREIVFGLRHEPYIAVRRPETNGRTPIPSVWAWSDAIASWDWSVDAGTPLIVEVYSDAEEIELLVNGRSVGRCTVGAQQKFRAEFEAAYEHGEIVAVAYSAGVEMGRAVLTSPEGPTRLELTVDRHRITASPADLAYVDIDLKDAAGVPVTSDDRAVEVTVDGPAVLQGLASARPDTDERFTATSQTTFDGHAIAVLRPTGAGSVTVTVHTQDGLDAQVEIVVDPA